MNSNTRFSRSRGFASKKDWENRKNGGTPVFKGAACNTDWDAPGSKRKSPHKYRKAED